MRNFSFYNPTKIHFGEGQIAKLGKEIPPGSRVLVTHGGGSIATLNPHNRAAWTSSKPSKPSSRLPPKAA